MRRKVSGPGGLAAEREALRSALRRLGDEKAKLEERIALDQRRCSEIRQQMAVLRSVGGKDLQEPFEEGSRVIVPRRHSDLRNARELARTLAPGLLKQVDEHQRTDRLREHSATGLARQVLLANGAPMHVDQILATLAAGGIQLQKDTLVVALARLARLNHVFRRIPGRANTFGLKDWIPSPAAGEQP